MSGAARVLVVTAPDDDVVVAYYAWSMGIIALADAPDRLRKGAGRYPQPAALLARLGVSIEHERRGLGAGLVQDVILRTAALAEEIGCRGLLVHAESTRGLEFGEVLGSGDRRGQSPPDANPTAGSTPRCR